MVAVDQGLADFGFQGRDAFDALGCYVVAAGIDDQVALAIGDLDEAVSVHHADVAGMQPAVDDGAVRGFLVLPVALHDGIAAHQDFAVIAEAHLDAGKGGADRLELDLVRPVDADHRRAFGLAVALGRAEGRGR